jgi:hypothetical protein
MTDVKPLTPEVFAFQLSCLVGDYRHDIGQIADDIEGDNKSAAKWLRSLGQMLERFALTARDNAEDAKRLDWLEGQVRTDVGINIHERLPDSGVGVFCMAAERSGKTLREAIDATKEAARLVSPSASSDTLRRLPLPDGGAK